MVSDASACAGIPTFSTFKDKTEEIEASIDDTIFAQRSNLLFNKINALGFNEITVESLKRVLCKLNSGNK